MSRVKKSPHEKDILFERIKELIDERRTTASQVSIKIGANRSFLADLFVGRKTTMSVNMLKRLASELGCDVGYLIGESPTPKNPKTSKVKLLGTIRAENWLPISRDTNVGLEVTCPTNQEYPLSKQKFYRLYINHDDLGRLEGIVNIIPDQPIVGDLCLVQREKGDLLERSIRKTLNVKEGFSLIGIDSKAQSEPIIIPFSYKTPKGVEILGIVSSIHYSISRS